MSELTLSQKAYQIAQDEEGVAEVPGDGNNPRILEYDQATDLKATADSVPWCSAFMNWCIQKAGGSGTRSAAARSWLSWGKKVDVPQEGDTVVFSSPLRGADAGHVAFYIKKSKIPGFILVFGGNQNDCVCWERKSASLVLGYRRSLDG